MPQPIQDREVLAEDEQTFLDKQQVNETLVYYIYLSALFNLSDNSVKLF